MEGRPLTKENTGEPNSCRTPSRESGPNGLERVREAARRDKTLKFTALLHHININLLRRSYYGLKRQVALGVDGVSGREDQLIVFPGLLHIPADIWAFIQGKNHVRCSASTGPCGGWRVTAIPTTTQSERCSDASPRAKIDLPLWSDACLHTRMRGQQPVLRLLRSPARCHFSRDRRAGNRRRHCPPPEYHQQCG